MADELEPIPDFIPGPYHAGWLTVETREQWEPGSEWTARSNVSVSAVRSCTGNDGIGTATLHRRYGAIRGPDDETPQVNSPTTLGGHWVRISYADSETEATPIWYGRIEDPATRSAGIDARISEAAEKADTGQQEWTAYEPSKQLEKQVYGAYFPPNAGENNPAFAQWLPDMNRIDGRGLTFGNRSENTYAVQDDPEDDVTYVFGSSGLWTRRQFLKYVLKRHLGPRWKVAGQDDLLADLRDHVELGSVETVESIVRKLLNARFGLDYRVEVDAEENFVLRVFTLTSQDLHFGETTFPKNPRTLQISLNQRRFFDRIARNESIGRMYRRVRVLSKRVVVCATLWGSRAASAAGVQNPALLSPRWTAAQQQAYDEPPLQDPDGDKDEARKNDCYAEVYAHLGLSSSFDLRRLTPVTTGPEAYAKSLYDWDPRPNTGQNFLLNTLSWLPLHEHYDYAHWPPSYIGPPGVPPELRKPLLLVFDETTPRMQPSETVGLKTEKPHQDLGIIVGADPNHLVALNHFTGVSATQPAYDYDAMVVTVAFESDVRASMTHEISEEAAIEAGIDPQSDYIIEAGNAECWWLAPGTIIGTRPDNGAVMMVADDEPANRGKAAVLREDLEEMKMLLAGAAIRYTQRRYRAELSAPGLWAWQRFLGSILTVIEDRRAWLTVEAPITSIEWQQEHEHVGGKVGSPPRTTLKTGFAK